MRTPIILYIALVLLLFSSQLWGQPSFQTRTQIRFTENHGQIRDADGQERPEIRYVATAPGMTLYFADGRISYVLAGTEQNTPDHHERNAASSAEGMLYLHRVDLQLIGASAGSVIRAEEPFSDYTNYYTARAPDGLLHIPSYHRILYREVWPDIDMAIYGTATGLKYDFIVRPGGRVADIRLNYVGADNVMLNQSGQIQVLTSLGSVTEHAPIVYQQASSSSTDTIRSSYLLDGNVLRFDIGRYDSTRTLVIDPDLEWSTFYGGDDLHSMGASVATDATGNVVMTGTTDAQTFPVTTGAFQIANSGKEDGFVVKFTSYGERLWATYYGGELNDNFYGVATGPKGSIAVCGSTLSSDFPRTTTSFQPSQSGADDACLVLFDSNGVRLWGTYLGGVQTDKAYTVAINAVGDIALAGETLSSNFPTSTSAYQRMTAGATDLFIACFTSNGARLWSTYYGGTGDETARSVAFDYKGNVLIAGQTASTDFPVFLDARQPTMVGASTAFAIKLDSRGNRQWATFLGGTSTSSSNTAATGIAADSAANVIVTGWTNDATFTTTAGSFQKDLSGKTDAFLIKMDSLGRRGWATYCGGKLLDSSLAIAVDRYGSIHLAGATSSSDFPVTTGIYPFGSILTGYVISFDSSGRQLWGTYHGGLGIDRITGIAVDTTVALAVTGTTASYDFPTTPGTFQEFTLYVPSAFLSKFGCDIPTYVKEPLHFDICSRMSQTLYAYPGKYFRWSTGETTSSIIVSKTGTYNYLWINESGCATRSGDITVTVHEPPTPVITGPNVLCDGGPITLSAPSGFRGYLWSGGETTEQITVTTPGTYRVAVEDEFGCSGESPEVTVTSEPRPHPAIITTRDSIACNGDSAHLITTGGNFSRYQWSTGETTPSIVVHQSGAYEVRVWNAAGCDAIARITIRGYQWQPAIRPLGPLEFCQGEQTTLAANADYATYLWSTGERTATITVGTSGTYWLQATDANGCTARSENVNVIVHPRPPVPTLSLTAKGLSASPAPSYQWNRDGIPIPGATDGEFTPDQPGSYTVTVTGANGCRSTSAPYEHDTEPSAAIAVGAYTAAPGGDVPVELRLLRSRNLARNGITRFTAVLRYRGSLLAPADRSLPTTADGPERLTTVTGDLPELAGDGSGLLARVYFTALLGDTTGTPIALESIVWHDGSVPSLDTTQGEFQLNGLCVQGGRRLLATGEEPSLKPARPDPTSGLTELEYAINEHGRVELFLVDANGRVIPLLSEVTSPGRYVVQFDASSLPSGSYSCVLRTPTVQLHQRLHVVR